MRARVRAYARVCMYRVQFDIETQSHLPGTGFALGFALGFGIGVANLIVPQRGGAETRP